MDYDDEVYEIMESIHRMCEDFLGAPNQCAWTDDIVRHVIAEAETLKKLTEG